MFTYGVFSQLKGPCEFENMSLIWAKNLVTHLDFDSPFRTENRKPIALTVYATLYSTVSLLPFETCCEAVIDQIRFKNWKIPA